MTTLQRQHALQAVYRLALVPHMQHSLGVCCSELAFQSRTAAQVADCFDIAHHTDGIRQQLVRIEAGFKVIRVIPLN